MRRSGTGSARRDQDGQSLVLVLVVCSVLALLVGTVVRQSLGSNENAANAGRGDVALAAADAGVARYIARLVASPRYWDRYVDQAEDTRLDTANGNQPHGPGSAWPQGRSSWAYSTTAAPSWTTLQTTTTRYGQVDYSLRVTPPPSGSDVVTVQATGRVGGTGASPKTRTIQTRVRPSSLADFQALSNASISYGSTATTTGSIYSAGNVDHDGIARATVYAVNRVTGSGTFHKGRYDSTTNPTTRTLYPSGVPFAQFSDDLDDIEAAAATQGNTFNAADARGWLVQFNANATVSVYKITSIPNRFNLAGAYTSGGSTADKANLSGYGINCTATTRPTDDYTLMWFEQPAVVGNSDNPCISGTQSMDSVLDGRVTIAGAGDMIVGSNISYETSGDDVLGMIATTNIYIGTYVPTNLTWRAATLAQTGVWRTAVSDRIRGTMTYTGSQAMYNGGSASMFATRSYNYDDTLVYQRPPLYPTISGTWKTLYWREVVPGT